MKNNLQNPPKEGLLFRDLFRFFWRGGVGSALGNDSVGQRWDFERFNLAMKEYGSSVDESTMKRWYAGERSPTHENMMTLARVAGDGKPKYVSAWRTEFNLSIIRQDLFKEQSQIPFSEGLVAIEPKHPLPSVSDLRACNTDCFNMNTLTCDSHVPYFEKGTKQIYLSFKFSGMPTGQVFQRRWYRNGEKFLEKTDFYDDAWPGYTYLFNRWGHDEGEYAFRVLVDGKRLATTRFLVEDA